jgi:DNA-binding PadR family transcriptional regulator
MLLETVQLSKIALRKTVLRFLDMIVLQFLNRQSMYGYELVLKVRKTFGVYLSPSKIYPLLATLERKGFVTSDWEICEKPRRVYKLTVDGLKMLKFTEESLSSIFRMNKFEESQRND